MSDSIASKVDMDMLSEIKEEIYRAVDIDTDYDDEQLQEIIEQCINRFSNQKIISIQQREKLREELFNSIRKLDILQELLEDQSITEIMINGYQNIFIERDGRIIRYNKQFESAQKLEDIAQKIAALSNRIVNESIPIVDTRLEDGSRVNIVLPPVAINGPIITIRKFYETPLTVNRLIELGSITKEAAAFLQAAVEAGYNIFVSGGTGSGKTTFLNALSNFIPKDERVITIEDSAELQIKGIHNLVRLEARNANVEGKNAVAIRDLIRASLRMRPDRIVVGEVRGAETVDMLQAMYTGHPVC
jgi:pilus assembly protein CpaF